MRYLFVTVDSAGALYPQLALAQRVRSRGHDVRFLACRSQRGPIAQAGFRVRSYEGPPDFDMTGRDGAIRDWADDPETAFDACCEHIWFGPASAVAADVLADVRREPVDGIVIDYFAYGAAAAAERLGLPMVVLWHTAFGEWPVFNRGLPALNTARTGLGLREAADVYEPYHRAERILVLTTECFDYALGRPRVPGNLRHVGPQFPPGQEPLAVRPVGTRQTPRVLVSLSTSYQAQEDLLTRIVAALADLPVKALVTTGPAVTLDGTAPANVEIRAWANHTEVLPNTDLVVTHAGLGTVMTAMAFGVPLLCVPMGRDQGGNAERVVQLGFGIAAEPSDGIDELRRSISTAVANAELRSRAIELAEECTRGEGYDAGAVELEVARSETGFSKERSE